LRGVLDLQRGGFDFWGVFERKNSDGVVFERRLSLQERRFLKGKNLLILKIEKK
jgi:hypothetical protein